MIAMGVQEGARLLNRVLGASVAGDPRFRQFLFGGAIGAKERSDSRPKDRVASRKFERVLARHARLVENRIGECCGKIIEKRVRLSAVEPGKIKTVSAGEADEQIGGHRPLVSLDEIDIGRGDFERRRHLRLGMALLPAQAPDLRAKE